jgi:hypothetical protein
MINTIACPHCKRAISYERSELYTPEKSLRMECTNCKQPVILMMTADGDGRCDSLFPLCELDEHSESLSYLVGAEPR